MSKRINVGVSDLFFNNDTVNYKLLYTTTPDDEPITEQMIREAVVADAQEFLPMLEAAGIKGVSVEDLVEDFMERL